MIENVQPVNEEDAEAAEDVKRQRSGIAFPYVDFESASKIASTIHGNVGHSDCSSGQIAAWLDVSPKSSGFRAQLAAAKLFGLIESDGPDNLRLTSLGQRLMDGTQERAAKVEAFLRVPLFLKIYEKYENGTTPPAAALEREISALGVPEKQKGRARSVLENSAQQTGFRAAAPNKLVKPGIRVLKTFIADSDGADSGSGNGGGGRGGDDGDLDLDPLIMALLRKIPKAAEGWPADKRLRWFKTFAMNVSQVYDDDSSPVELVITMPASN